MIERGELRLPEVQRRYVWRSTRVRDLLDSLYRGYTSGAILLWETDEDVPLQDFALDQHGNPLGCCPAPQGFLGHLIAREFSQEECRDGEARSGIGGGGSP